MRTTKVLCISILLLSAIFLNSCGTTHHFVPPRPLENKEYLISVNWHFDFDNDIRSLVFPELSFYLGIDNTNTIGAGYQFPIFLSHISHIRYFENDFNKYWNLSSHLNKPFGLNNNPILEIEFSFASKEKYYWQMISAGISITNREDIPLLLYLDNGFTEKNLMQGISLIPVFKYQIGGNDLAFSYIHYHGLTRASLNKIKKDIQENNEVIIKIPRDKIKNIINQSRKGGYPYSLYILNLTNGDSLKLLSPYRHGDQMSFRKTNNNYLAQIGFVDYKVHIYKATGDGEIGKVTLRISDLIESYENNEDIIIRRYALEILDEINKLNSFKVDHSVGLSIQSYKNRGE